MPRSRVSTDPRTMHRYPTFYLWGALAGCALWVVHAPTPFPLLAAILVASGGAGCALSLTYLYCYEHWEWRVKAAALRRFVRTLTAWPRRMRMPRRFFARLQSDRPVMLESDAAAAGMTPVGLAIGTWTIAP